MEEEEQPKAMFDGEKQEKTAVLGRISSSSSHETSKQESSAKKDEETFAASDSFCSTMCAMMSKPDIEKIGQLQLETLTRYQEMNGRFNDFNRYSFERYEKISPYFQNHTRMIVDMKKDLDIIFRRVRNLKSKLARQYGGAFAVTSATIQKLEEEIEADHEDYKEEKPQTAQQGSPPSDHPPNTTTDVNSIKSDNTVDQAQGPSSSGANNASGSQTNDIRKEKQTIDKSLNQEREVQRSLLRPQLSSSDDSYSSDDADDTRKDKQMVTTTLSQEVPKSVLRPQLSSSDDNYDSEETDEDMQGIQTDDNPAKEHTSNLENRGKVQPEISSSDESIEDDTDESEENSGRRESTSLSSEEEEMDTQTSNNKAMNDGDG